MKLLSILACTLFGISILILSNESIVFAQTNTGTNNATLQNLEHAIQLTANTEGKLQIVTIPTSQLLFDLTPNFDNKGNLVNFGVSLRPELANLYTQLAPPSNLKTVFVYPIFTQAAYGKNGFYDYYNKKCDASCLTISIPQPAGYYSSSGEGALVLHLLGYDFITDIDVDKNPDILKQYDRIIVLHNEYVTKKEFDAITNHPDVIFLYPNSLFAEVKTDYASNTITLINGHGYPDQKIHNGFNWKYDNSKYEYDVLCNDWNFYQRGNYTLLNCYPEYRMYYDQELLRELRSNDPTELISDVSNWLRYQNNDTTDTLLDNYDLHGKYIPAWVQNPSIWLLNGQISKDEYGNLLIYLFNKE